MRSTCGWRGTFLHIPFERYADDVICHCKSAEEAQALWSALADRFAACKLVLHPEKTKIVYCKDANRRGDFPNQSFDFLGFTFRARKTIWQGDIACARLHARGQPESADGHQPDDPAMDASSSQRQVPARSGQRRTTRTFKAGSTTTAHFYRTQLRPTLTRIDALCHPLGAPEVQAACAATTEGSERLA